MRFEQTVNQISQVKKGDFFIANMGNQQELASKFSEEELKGLLLTRTTMAYGTRFTAEQRERLITYAISVDNGDKGQGDQSSDKNEPTTIFTINPQFNNLVDFLKHRVNKGKLGGENDGRIAVESEPPINS